MSAAIVLLLIVPYAAISTYAMTRGLQPDRNLPRGTPADVGLVYEPIAFESALDRTPLRGWYLPSKGERAIIELHGIDGNRWDTDHPWLTRMTVQLIQDGFDVFVFDFRGHGESGGHRQGLGWDERGDVLAAVRVVEAHGIAPGHIGLYGMSYGGGSALLSAALSPEVAAVVTDSAYANQSLLVSSEIRLKTGLPPVFTPGVRLLGSLLYGFDLEEIAPEKALPSIAPRPILFIHGTADTRIPVEHAYRLMAASRNTADEFWIVSGAQHTDSYRAEPERYPARVLAFWEQHL